MDANHMSPKPWFFTAQHLSMLNLASGISIPNMASLFTATSYLQCYFLITMITPDR
jgi:hypothetical protein